MKRSISLWVASLALVVLLSGSAEAVLTHYWNFEEPNGTPAPQVKDTAGTRPGNFAGNMTDADRSSDVPANNGVVSTRSLDFGTPNGTTGANYRYVDVYTPSGSYLDMPSTSNWTADLWYRGTEASGVNTANDSGIETRVLVGSSAGNANLELTSNGKVVFSHYNGGWQYNVISAIPVNDNLWHNIGLVNHSNQTADLYVDGVAQVTGVDSTTSVTFPWKIGSFMTAVGTIGNFTSGKLDDVRIYDNSLTATDVFKLVPEPNSVALMGLAGLLVWRRKRREE